MWVYLTSLCALEVRSLEALQVAAKLRYVNSSAVDSFSVEEEQDVQRFSSCSVAAMMDTNQQQEDFWTQSGKTGGLEQG